MAPSVRKAVPGDASFLASVVGQHWKVSLDYAGQLGDPNTVVLVAEDGAGGPPVGMALMWVRRWNSTGQLGELAVDGSRLRQGFGSELMRALAAEARRRGLRSIIVETQPGNQAALDFYLALGLRICGYNDRYYTNAPKGSRDVALFLSLDL